LSQLRFPNVHVSGTEGPVRRSHGGQEARKLGVELYFDDLEVGRQWTSDGCTVSTSDIRNFADLSGDHNPIHTDPEFARSTPFRGCIAHGHLGLSIASGLMVGAPPTRALAFLEIRGWYFRAPVYPGDVLRVQSRVLAKEGRSRGRRGVVTWEVRVMNQAGRVVQEGVTLTLVEGRGEAVTSAPSAMAASGR
jgi:acyl dehydratase